MATVRRKIRQYARQHGIRITIPRKVNEHRTGPCNRAIYRQRNKIERLVDRCKQFRRLATRYGKRANHVKVSFLLVGNQLDLV